MLQDNSRNVFFSFIWTTLFGEDNFFGPISIFYWRVTPTLFVIDDLELYKRCLKKREIIAIPRQCATVMEEHNLSNVEVCWVTLAMIEDFKSFLRLRYESLNEDIEKQRFEVKNIAWLNFG